jgi:hypothetical protein
MITHNNQSSSSKPYRVHIECRPGIRNIRARETRNSLHLVVNTRQYDHIAARGEGDVGCGFKNMLQTAFKETPRHLLAIARRAVQGEVISDIAPA